jgi:uncharacterized protein YndB with AHSA1/START domain
MDKTKITKNLDENIIIIERTFNASIKDVWSAWTIKDNFEKWWAPKPWKAVAKTFDFSNNGHCLYYMQSPEGEKHWSYIKYLTINLEKNLTIEDYFCDENGNKNINLPSLNWFIEFLNENEQTKIRVTITTSKKEDLQTIIEMGFEQGFSMGLDNLEELIPKKQA